MKRTLKITALILALSFLCACSSLSDNRVETLISWSFQYNEGTNDYSVFFALLDKNDNYIAADVDADIRIIDEDGNKLYSATRSVAKGDFATYSSKAAGEEYLANVRIRASEIAEGTSTNGTVYLTIHKDDTIRFDEVNCKALYCLPIKDVALSAEPLPVELSVKGFDGKTESTIQIDDIAYDFDGSISPILKITLSGVKTYSNEKSAYKSPYDIISYKLYDSGEYMVASGNVYLSSLAVGDKFKDDSIVIYDVKPGESYVLKLTEYDW